MMRKTIVDNDLSQATVPAREVEVFPGVLERRHFLRSSVVTAAAIFAMGATVRGFSTLAPTKDAPAAASDKLTWDDFLKQAVPVAQQMIGELSFSLDEYLYRIGSLATRLKEIPDTKLFPYIGVDPRVLFAPSFRGTPFFIIQWRMEAGAMLPAHNHPNASVCTLGYEGEVRLRNFEIAGEAPEYSSKKTFRVRETHSELIAPGRINTLSPSRDNIHYFQVGKTGARGIDITTLHGKPAPFSFLDISDKPADTENRIFEAAWNELGRR